MSLDSTWNHTIHHPSLHANLAIAILSLVHSWPKDPRNAGHLGLHQALGRPQRHPHTLLHPRDLVPCWRHWLPTVSSASQTCSFLLLASTVAVPLLSSDMSWSTTLTSEWCNHSCFHVSSSCYTWSSGPCSQTSLTTAATPGVDANAPRELAPLLSRRPSRAPFASTNLRAVPLSSCIKRGPHRYRLWYGTLCSHISASSEYSWYVEASPSQHGTPSRLRSTRFTTRSPMFLVGLAD